MPMVIPDACALPTAERPLRLAEFDALFDTAVRQVESVGPTHCRLRLTGPAGLAATVRDLTARETECCSFFAFTVTPQPAGDGEAVTPRRRGPGPVRRRARFPGPMGRLPPGWTDTVTGTLLDLEELATHAEVPVERLRHYAEAEQQHRATQHRPGTPGWVQATTASVPLAEEAGLALRFPMEADLAATLARLAAAEYRCCSFGSYTIVIDHTGLRLEVRMPDDASGMLAAVLGLPDPVTPSIKDAHGVGGAGARSTPAAPPLEAL